MNEKWQERIAQVVSELCQEANYEVRKDVLISLKKAWESEKKEPARKLLYLILENIRIAREQKIPLCQDTGMTEVFLEVGEGLFIEGKLLEEAVTQGVSRGYREGYLRKSVVKDPLFARCNTGDNTPALIHFFFGMRPAKKIKITVFPRGFGAENMTQLALLSPSQGVRGVKRFVIRVVREAGANACPPVVVGVGIGGTAEKCLALSKKALLRPLNSSSPHPDYARVEKALYESINKLEIGPQGLGGKHTCLGVNIEYFPTHIAGLPVGVSISCYALRQASRIVELNDKT